MIDENNWKLKFEFSLTPIWELNDVKWWLWCEKQGVTFDALHKIKIDDQILQKENISWNS